MKTVFERLQYDFLSDFKRLLSSYLSCDEHDFCRHTANHFRLIKEKHPACMNHRPVLAVSLGGSKTKLAIASMDKGIPYFHHIVVRKNPTAPIHFYHYLDQLLFDDPVVTDYLNTAKSPVICFTLPVMMTEDNIPFHPVKIANILGLFARNESQMTENMRFDVNIAKYFNSKNCPMPLVYVQSDPVIAHLGGFTLINHYPEERTILLVCGTGMATADDNIQRVISRLRMIDFDEDLYPENFTEGYVYESACSGKGLYDIMRRAILIRSAEPNAKLDAGLADFFVDLYDSVLVAYLWENSLGAEIQDKKFLQLQSKSNEYSFKELQHIATSIMDRVVGSLAATVLVTAIKLNQREYISKYFLLFEGSIALDPYINNRVIKLLEETLKSKDLFASLSVPVPEINLISRPYHPLKFSPQIGKELQEKVDITLVGTVVAAVTQDVLESK